MKLLSRMLISGILASTIGITNGATGMEPINIDLHQQRIGIWNIEEKVGAVLPTAVASEVFSLNLSDNSLRDVDIETLMEMMRTHNLVTHIQSLNLSNNRLTLEGVKKLIPLLSSDQLRWVDVSINNLMVDDFCTLWKLIEMEARRISIIEGVQSSDEKRDEMASKIVLLQGSYNVERFGLPGPFILAHQQYYRTRSK